MLIDETNTTTNLNMGYKDLCAFTFIDNPSNSRKATKSPPCLDNPSESMSTSSKEDEVRLAKKSSVEIAGKPAGMILLNWINHSKSVLFRFAGTIIDNKVCHPKNNDFYLCSHAGMIGTTRPTHYHVLCDELGFSADDLQDLVHSLSYVYQRSTTAISVGCMMKMKGVRYINRESIFLTAPPQVKLPRS